MPAYGQSCRRCGAKNHFSKKCKSKNVQVVSSGTPDDSSTQGMNSIFIGAVGGEPSTPSRSWSLPFSVGFERRSESVEFKIDTGAEANIIPKQVVENLQALIQPASTRLLGYNRSVIPNIGKVTLSVENSMQKQNVDFEVVNGNLPPVLGLESCRLFGVVSQVNSVANSLLDEFPEVFQGIGCLQTEHEICVDPAIKPALHAARRIPMSMLDKVKQELDSMEQSHIITKVDEPTEWVNSM